MVSKQINPGEKLKGFLRHRWWPILVAVITVIMPMVLAIWLLTAVVKGKLDVSILQNISGNNYLTNNILILFISVSYLIVALSLIFYFFDIYDEAFDYKGNNRWIKFMSKAAATLTVIAGVLVVWYIGTIVFGFKSGWSEITFRTIIEDNKHVTIECFIIFIIIDLLIIKSKKIENVELVKQINGGSNSVELTKKLLHNNNGMDLSWWSTFLISLPTILITAIIWWLLNFISEHPKSFLVVHDVSHVIDESKVDWFLFNDGIETGMIAASVILSQIIFAVLKLRFHYRMYEIDIENQPPVKDESDGKQQAH